MSYIAYQYGGNNIYHGNRKTWKGSIVLYDNMLYVEVMYHFNKQVDFKISSKLIWASKGLNKHVQDSEKRQNTNLKKLHCALILVKIKD